MSVDVTYPEGWTVCVECDRCHTTRTLDHTALVDYPDGWVVVRTDRPGHAVGVSSRADLCPDCAASLTRWMVGDGAS